MTNKSIEVESSFRDPSGFVFHLDSKIYRQINPSYQKDYELLMSSGLYQNLTDQEFMISHQEVDREFVQSKGAYKIIQPEKIAYISYPYEWCFSQLKDAASLTLRIAREAIDYGMVLKDASAYNIQFRDGRPVFIDTLSFRAYQEGEPWVAYRQFCQHFLSPLALMACRDVRLNQMLKLYMDGIPLDLASSLLPKSTYLRFSLLTHIHLHAKTQKAFENKPVARDSSVKMSKISFLGLIDNLESSVKKLKLKYSRTEWSNYYNETNYSDAAFVHKKEIVAGFINKAKPKSIWDFGANTGVFSRLSSQKGIGTVAFDIDPLAVEFNYHEMRKQNESCLLPLILDLNNPSPGIGWNNSERLNILDRGKPDMIFALALIHHLAISNNLPFHKIASYISNHCQWLMIEFVPKGDSQVERLLKTREDIFEQYDQGNFEDEFSKYFSILESIPIKTSKRILYLMENVAHNTSSGSSQKADKLL